MGVISNSVFVVGSVVDLWYSFVVVLCPLGPDL